MPDKLDLYDNAYGNYTSDVYERVRIETYGADLGQTSWVTQEESADIPKLLKLTGDSVVLEIGCGSGAYALHGERHGMKRDFSSLRGRGGQRCSKLPARR